MLKSLNKIEKDRRKMMTKYIVKEHSILYKEVEADSPEEAEEIALGEPVHSAEEYVEVEEGELL
jgi:hypothetical protein